MLEVLQVPLENMYHEIFPQKESSTPHSIRVQSI